MMLAASCPASAAEPTSIADVFGRDTQNGLVMQVEAAISTAQAETGVISAEAAHEINEKADTRYAPLADIDDEYSRVGHHMVALLNVWRRALSDDASDALHVGVTTVDIYDTVLVLQLLQSIDLYLSQMQSLEQDLVCLANEHKDTAMIGRTLGQHALPITFGKKVAVWAAQNRRNIDRLYETQARLRTSGVLKGAVGTHLGLGDEGAMIEARVSAILGLDEPEPADWRPARDVFAEYAQVLALISNSNAAIGAEVFRLQMTDIAEVYERRIDTAVGSSTMPHKRNPKQSESLIHYGRTAGALSGVVLDDVVSVFERDDTSRVNDVLEDISVEAGKSISATRHLIGHLDVYPERMAENMRRTDGMIMAQRIVLFLGERMSRHDAELRVRDAAARSLDEGIPFRTALLDDGVMAPLLKDEVDRLLTPETYLGLASEQVTMTSEWIDARRRVRGEPILADCSNR